MSKILTIGLAGFLACVVSTAASGSTVYTVSSGITQVDTVITPFVTAQTGNDFYNFTGSEANPSFDLDPNTLHVYLHQELGTSNVSLGYIFNTNDDDDGATSGGSFVGTITGALASATGGIQDDAAEDFGWDASDAVDGATTVNGNFAFAWASTFTDGFTLNTTADDFWAIDLAASTLTGIDTFVFLHGDPTAPTVLSVENPADAFLRVTSTPMSPVPLPAGLPLLAGGLATLGWVRRRSA